MNASSSTARPDAAARPKRDKRVQPFLKWAGGKRQLLNEIRKFYPREKFRCYFEPFVGGGAVLLDLQPEKAVVNDSNPELVNLYNVIRAEPEALIREAERHPVDKAHYYRVRQLDRDERKLRGLSAVERAARIMYLNKTCYNGLFRVNSRSEFNVPFGDYKNPKIVDRSVIAGVSSYLNTADVEILNGDFAEAVTAARKGDFLYFDPPYHPVSDTASFTGYDCSSFNREDQLRLRTLADRLSDKGCRILLSNSDTPFIRELYADSRYELVEVQAKRNINSIASKRSRVGELLIFNKYAVTGVK